MYRFKVKSPFLIGYHPFWSYLLYFFFFNLSNYSKSISARWEILIMAQVATNVRLYLRADAGCGVYKSLGGRGRAHSFIIPRSETWLPSGAQQNEGLVCVARFCTFPFRQLEQWVQGYYIQCSIERITVSFQLHGKKNQKVQG